jgi:hypothetical protein
MNLLHGNILLHSCFTTGKTDREAFNMKKVIIFLVVSLILPVASYAYDLVEVKNGGNIEGIVEFKGDIIPKDEILNPSTDVEYCGKSLPAEKFLISPYKKIKNVVVYLEEIKAGKALSREAVTMTNRKCAFVPHVSIGFKGNTFVALNDDPLFHIFHISASINGRHLYSIGLHEQGLKVSKPLVKTGLMEITCDVHYIFDHPYAAVTNENGEFLIKDVPPLHYRSLA